MPMFATYVGMVAFASTSATGPCVAISIVDRRRHRRPHRAAPRPPSLRQARDQSHRGHGRVPHRARGGRRRDLVVEPAQPAEPVLADRLRSSTATRSPCRRSRVYEIVTALVVMALVAALFRFTNLGLQLRASALAPEVSRLLGVRVGRMLTLGWMLSTGGRRRDRRPRLVELLLGLTPSVMDGIFAFGFIAAAVGGLESPVGAIVAGVVARHHPAVRRRLRQLQRVDPRRARHPHRVADGSAQRPVRPEHGEAGVRRLTGWRFEAPVAIGVAWHRRGRRDHAARRRRAHDVARVAVAFAGLAVPSSPGLRERHPVLVRAARRVASVGALLVATAISRRRRTSTSPPARPMAIVLLGLSFLTGASGQISLGNGAFMGVGAFAMAIWANHHATTPIVVVARARHGGRRRRRPPARAPRDATARAVPRGHDPGVRRRLHGHPQLLQLLDRRRLGPAAARLASTAPRWLAHLFTPADRRR